MVKHITIKDTPHNPTTTVDLEEDVATLLGKEATIKATKENTQIIPIQITCDWANLNKSHNSNILRLQFHHKTLSNLWDLHQLTSKNSQSPF